MSKPLGWRKNIKGEKFGRLSVIEAVGQAYRGETLWRCLCDCGKEHFVPTSRLTRGITKSCGCYAREFNAEHVRKLRQPKKHPYYWRALYSTIRAAKLRGYTFELSIDEFLLLSSLPCHYCGKPPSNRARSRENEEPFICSGLDRKDNMQGYTLENVVPCCGVCNQAKSDRSYQEFLDWIEVVYKNTIEPSVVTYYSK